MSEEEKKDVQPQTEQKEEPKVETPEVKEEPKTFTQEALDKIVHYRLQKESTIES